MTTEPRTAKDIFVELVGNVHPDQWDERLSEICIDNDDLRNRVRALLRAHTEPDSFLEQPAVAGDATVLHDSSIAERPGTVIGPYKLLQQIGEGGMGVVFMAEQSEPIQRTVALKIIKPGMDTRQVIARFEAERQALALMDHPNIAKVLDAGTTPGEPGGVSPGRPFFVMELVKGVPITEYCDRQHLSVRERLELMSAVCHAVQHAHQKGIIHRDIKPTNVLVAEYDGHPVPKVIDFGVAKATAQKLTERTMFTEFGQVIGTVEYMSPEQAKLNQLDIDTRSDVYSLGVLLYELLTGSTPFGRKRLNEAAFDEMLRIIREEEPPKPSTRLSSTDGLPSIAANRSLEPLKLSRLVQGELDWIVMKALEKDRNRRYETASGLALDVHRYLSNEPVEAGPPSVVYRIRKFAQRNRAALVTAITAALAVLVAAVSIGWVVRDRVAREQQRTLERSARQAKVSGQLELILDEVAQLEQAEKWSEALASARRAEPALATEEAAPDIQERVRQTLSDLELVQKLEEIRAQGGTVWVTADSVPRAAEADQQYAAALRQAGIDIDALSVSEAAHRIAASRPIAAALLPAIDDWLAARSMVKNVEVRSMNKDETSIRWLADVLQATDPDPWRQRVREALVRKDQAALANLATAEDLDRQPAATLTLLYSALWASGKLREQELILRRAQWKYPDDYWINHRLGVDLIWRHAPNEIRDGIGFLRAAVALRPDSAHSIMNLGIGYKYLGQYDKAIACYQKAIELQPTNAASYNNLGIALGEKGLHDEAIVALEQARKLRPPDDPSTYGNLAWLLANSVDVERRDPDKAVELANRAAQLSPSNSFYATALGVAHYRAGDWRGAVEALEKSDELPPSRSIEGINALFLAMAHWQLGQLAESRRYYGRAIEWMETQQTEEAELIRFRAEAEKLLRFTDDKQSAKPAVEAD